MPYYTMQRTGENTNNTNTNDTQVIVISLSQSLDSKYLD